MPTASTPCAYTPRPDTLFSATTMVLFARAHKLVDELKSVITNWADVQAYAKTARARNDFERTELNKDKTGVALEGVKGDQPASAPRFPVWISDYVLTSYGTGAIMAVPAHDDATGRCQEVRSADN